MTFAGRATVPHLPSERARRGLPRLAAVAQALLLGLAPGLPVLASPPGVAFDPGAGPTGAGSMGAGSMVSGVDDEISRCRVLRDGGASPLLRERQQSLRASLPPGPSLEEVLLTAERLLACAAPEAALAVLARLSPAPGADRRRWLVMQWRAAHAGLRHDLAVQALTLLAGGDVQRLEALQLPLALPGDDLAAPPAEPPSQPATRSALDLLADHLVSLGRGHEAAEVLLASSSPGALTAARWGRAAVLADELPLQERDRIMELALEESAAAGAWGLVAALLDQQLAAGVSDEASERALERRLRLGRRIDDAYGEWVQRRRLSGPEHELRNAELERQLRSPLDPGGHAGPPPLPEPAPDPDPDPAPDLDSAPDPEPDSAPAPSASVLP
jgi:hypothetical protein